MISPEDLQSALLALLKANANLVTAVGAEIREENWQGTNFVYPCVRLKTLMQYARGNGTCRLDESTLSFQAHVYSEQDSSYECSTIIGLVYVAVAGKRLHTPTVFRSLEINPRGVLSPYREPTRIWSANAFFDTVVYKSTT